MKDKINGRTPEEIKKGLEVCVGENIVCDEECPYCSIVRYPRCRNAVERDALAYIKRLEQKLFLKPLSWDEAMGDDAFLEVKGVEYIDAALNLFACCTEDGSVKDGFVFYETHNSDGLKLMECDYGKTWRCWARRPTDEERATAVWEVE